MNIQKGEERDGGPTTTSYIKFLSQEKVFISAQAQYTDYSNDIFQNDLSYMHHLVLITHIFMYTYIYITIFHNIKSGCYDRLILLELRIVFIEDESCTIF